MKIKNWTTYHLKNLECIFLYKTFSLKDIETIILKFE